ncbi:tripartite ATP-independent transporter DctM subunit [Stella humosa]|uniref:TRAP transporter large permease protein n=1 Tax=Stella humosa TaxID=94 RepID=A0A3N1KYE4_9PROT|nr:TRAP transporter large permease [Stella humosa]ROP84452.1 tripartite ATP-independent transporter DctM subunit [Stella humosa]BBK33970.1 C4-dicarboxylate ABC transporter permease [Stella humosa]
MTSAHAVGIAGILLMLAMMFLRVPIAVAMLTAGAGGYVVLSGWTPLLSHLKTGPYLLLASDSFSVIPLFLLMGYIAARAGISRALFGGAHAVMGHVRGGLALAAVGGCAMFGAICGSSLATAATMGQVALPEMRRHGYSGRLATGTLAAGGTLGILIPPSIGLIVYGILAEQNIAKLFLAAFVPGLIAALGYMAAIMIQVRLRPQDGPPGGRATRAERLRALVAMGPPTSLFLLVLGGIYSGVFTPTEAASFGVLGALLLALLVYRIPWAELTASLLDTALSSAMIFLILIGADVFNAFMALSGVPQGLADAIGHSGMAPMAVLVAILLIYVVLGCLMDSISMIILTLPIFLPAVLGLDFGMTPEHTAIWFGILVLVVIEVGLITPPVGMNVFVINKLAGDVPMAETFRGVVPFLVSDFVRVVLLVAFPVLSWGVLDLVGW